MRLADIQPQYFPRLHYFARMFDADVFVFRDDVQFVRNHKYPDGRRGMSYQVHTPIKSPAGIHLLTVSVKKGSAMPINQTGISYDHEWPKKHINVIKTFYRTSPNLRALMPELEALLAQRFDTVAELNVATTCWALGHVLGVPLRIPDDLKIARINELLTTTGPGRLRRIGLGSIYLASCASQNPSERIAILCQTAEANEYLAGGTAIDAYLDPAPFRTRYIELVAQKWTCPTYPQRFSDQTEHIPDLSILDLLMNASPATITSTLIPQPR